MAQAPPTVDLWAWRHPRAIGAAGRCIGRTDLAVDRRKAKRLAARIRQAARRHGLPREIWTSPLRRAAEVGRVLRGWGWTHRVDERLLELDFGLWDGRPWHEIDRGDVACWETDFVHHAPGGGESQAALRLRIEQFLVARSESGTGAPPVLLVTHAGWIGTLLAGDKLDDAAHWPAPTPHMGLRRVRSDPSRGLRPLDRSL
jgi:alpha-ribazole phosphatase